MYASSGDGNYVNTLCHGEIGSQFFKIMDRGVGWGARVLLASPAVPKEHSS